MNTHNTQNILRYSVEIEVFFDQTIIILWSILRFEVYFDRSILQSALTVYRPGDFIFR